MDGNALQNEATTWLLGQMRNIVKWPQNELRRYAAFTAEERYLETRRIEDFEEAIRLARQNIEFSPDDNRFLAALGTCLADRYEETRTSDGFDEAISLFRQVHGNKPDESTKTHCCMRLSQLYRTGAERTGNLAYAEEALRLGKKAVDECRVTEFRAGCLEALALAHYYLFIKTNSLDHLEETIRSLRQAIKTAHDKLPHLHDMFLFYLNDHYARTGELFILEEIISSLRRSVILAPNGSQKEFGQLFALSDHLHDWYKKTGATESLKEATEVHEKATQIARRVLASAFAENKGCVGVLMAFGRAMYRWYTRTDTTADLIEAIRLVKRAIDLTPLDYPDQVQQLMLYARFISHWSEEIGPISELKEEIQVVLQVFDLAPNDFLEETRPITRLIHWLHAYYHLTRDLKYLEQSISTARRILDMVPKENTNMANILYELVLALSSRYENTRALADLKEIVKTAKYMVDATSADHPDRIQRLLIYSDQMITLYRRDPTQASSSEAIEAAKLAVELDLSNGGSAVKPTVTLGRALILPFSRSKNVKDLEESVEALRQAVRRATVKVDQTHALNGLSHILYKRYEISHQMEDLNEAIDLARRAKELYPVGRYGEYIGAAGLANYLLERQRRTRTKDDLDEAIELLLLSTKNNRRPYFSEVISSGRNLVNAYGYQHDLQAAFEVSSRMIDLVPTMIPHSLENADKQWVLQFMYGIATFAAHVGLRIGKSPFEALTILEKGRGMLGTSLDQIRRTDIMDLQESHPDLASRFFRLKSQLDKPFDRTDRSDNVSPVDKNLVFGRQALFDHHYHAGTEFNQVVEEISKLSGFETFYSLPTEDDVRNTAIHGPLVVINELNTGYDAIIIEQHQIRVLPLPALRFKDVQRRVYEGNLGRLSIFEWLWDTTMSPILEALGYSQPVTNDSWPHVWWIPTGRLCKLPLHAAGYHTQDVGETVLSRVISSYSSSVKSIIYGRRRRRRHQSQQALSLDKALLIAMEHTPRHPRLPFATKEIDELDKLCTSMSLNVNRSVRTKRMVLDHLQQCDLFHFAGHGHTDPNNPSQSYLCLERDRITVADLMELDLYSRFPFLAYLSACGTGQINDEGMMDESIHLISSCQMAGFRHVIGTLWEVNDEICVDIAKTVYEGMRDGKMSDGSVARGLHDASRLLRDRWVATVRNTDAEAYRSGRVADGTRKIDPHTTNVTGLEELFTEKATIGTKQSKYANHRDIVDGEVDDMISALWAPYVHFGI